MIIIREKNPLWKLNLGTSLGFIFLLGSIKKAFVSYLFTDGVFLKKQPTQTQLHFLTGACYPLPSPFRDCKFPVWTPTSSTSPSRRATIEAQETNKKSISSPIYWHSRASSTPLAFSKRSASCWGKPEGGGSVRLGKQPDCLGEPQVRWVRGKREAEKCSEGGHLWDHLIQPRLQGQTVGRIPAGRPQKTLGKRRAGPLQPGLELTIHGFLLEEARHG